MAPKKLTIKRFAWCPSCKDTNYSVEVRIDHENHAGEASCHLCSARPFRMRIHARSKPGNVYGAWKAYLERVPEERPQRINEERRRPRRRAP